ncbi:MAG: hypothetical protein H6P94_942 [Thermoplasmatales archaeon]|nr:hypothetical protein [Thermoplasmatales archaeon]MCU0851326.1 hypothetical protein [Candidatus Thermoplasmatota archaeon]
MSTHSMMKPISVYKWECQKCVHKINTFGRARGRSSKNWLSRHLVNRVIHQHIKLYHGGEAIMVLLKKRTTNGKQTEKVEMFY